MNFLLSVLSPFLKYREQQLEKNSFFPLPQQQKIFKEIIAAVKDTKLAKQQKILNSTTLATAKKLAAISYPELRPTIEQVYQLGKAGTGIMSWSPIQGFAMTSGSSGGTKYFPITNASLNHFQKSSFSLYAAIYADAAKTNNLFNGKALVLAASPFKKSSPTGLPVGYMSGYLLTHSHPLVRHMLYPSNHVAYQPSWEEKIILLLQEIQQQNINLISGFPASIKLFTLDALKYYKVDFLREIFPDLQYCIYGGNFLSPEDKNIINKLWTGEQGKKIIFYENYSAVEGFFGHTFRQDWPGMIFNTAHNFFQFKTAATDNEFVQLHEVEENKQYLVYISNINGLFNYALDDIIKITSVKPLTFQFISRAQEQISFIAEKLLLEEIQFALAQFSKSYQVTISDFVVWLERNKPARLMFGICFEKSPENLSQDALVFLDNALRTKNFIYDDYRKDNIYGLVAIEQYPKQFFDDYRRRNIDRGNFKEKRLFNCKEDFIATYSNKS